MNQKNDVCFYCKKEILGNTPLILKKHGPVGYDEYNFCSGNCLVSELEKKKFIVTWINEQRLSLMVNKLYRDFFMSDDQSKQNFLNHMKRDFLPKYEKLKADERRK